jgi:hypothetical protein
MVTAEFLLSALLAMTQPGAEAPIPPALTGSWQGTVLREAPLWNVDPRASAVRYFYTSNFLTVKCELRFNPEARLDLAREDVRLHIAAHELGHCHDERPAPAGADAHVWPELYADVWGALAMKAVGRDATTILRGRPLMAPYIIKILEALRAAPADLDVRAITIAAYQIREAILNPTK